MWLESSMTFFLFPWLLDYLPLSGRALGRHADSVSWEIARDLVVNQLEE